MKLDAKLEFLIEMAYEQGYSTTRKSNVFQQWALAVHLLSRRRRERKLASMRSTPPPNYKAPTPRVPVGEESGHISVDELKDLEKKINGLSAPRTATLGDDDGGWV